jgi:WD40 repeat protein
LEINPDNTLLFYGSFDYSIKVYDLENSRLKKSLKGHTNYVWSLVISKDQHYLISGGSDCSIRVWDLTKNFELVHFVNHGTSVLTLTMGVLNDYVYFAGSRYQPVKRLNLKKKLKSPPAEFKKYIKKSNKDTKASKNPFSFFKKKKKENVEIKTNIPENIKKNPEFQRMLSDNEKWMKELNPKCFPKVKSLIANYFIEKEKNENLKKQNELYENSIKILKNQQIYLENKEQKLTRQLKEYEIKQSKISMNYSSIRQKNKDFGIELVEMIKKYNLVLKEKNILQTTFNTVKIELNAKQMICKNHLVNIQNLKEQNKNLKNTFHKNLSSNFEKNSEKLTNISDYGNSVVSVKNADLEERIKELEQSLQKKENNITYYHNIIENYKKENNDYKNKIKILSGNNFMKRLTGKESEYLKKLVSMMEDSLNEMKSEKQKVENKNKLLTQEFYNLSKQFNTQNVTISRLIKEKNNIQNQVNLYQLPNQEIRNSESQVKRMIRSSSLSSKNNIQFVIKDSLTGKEDQQRFSMSLPVKKKKLRRQNSKPINVYINNHILEGESREQTIDIRGTGENSNYKRTVKNNFSPNIWN